MNKYLTIIKKYLSKLLVFVQRYAVILFFILFAGLAGYLVIHIGELSKSEPTQAQIDEKTKDILKVKIDEEVAEKLKELQDKNISLETLFDNGRTNPFED